MCPRFELRTGLHPSSPSPDCQRTSLLGGCRDSHSAEFDLAAFVDTESPGEGSLHIEGLTIGYPHRGGWHIPIRGSGWKMSCQAWTRREYHCRSSRETDRTRVPYPLRFMVFAKGGAVLLSLLHAEKTETPHGPPALLAAAVLRFQRVLGEGAARKARLHACKSGEARTG